MSECRCPTRFPPRSPKMSTALVSPTIFDLSEVLCKVRAPAGVALPTSGLFSFLRVRVRASPLPSPPPLRFLVVSKFGAGTGERRAGTERGHPVSGRWGLSRPRFPPRPLRRRKGGGTARAPGGLSRGAERGGRILPVPPGPPRYNTPGRGAAGGGAAAGPGGRAGSVPSLPRGAQPPLAGRAAGAVGRAPPRAALPARRRPRGRSQGRAPAARGFRAPAPRRDRSAPRTGGGLARGGGGAAADGAAEERDGTERGGRRGRAAAAPRAAAVGGAGVPRRALGAAWGCRGRWWR